MYCEKLTHEDLDKLGFKHVYFSTEENQWVAIRYWYPSGKAKEKQLVRLKPRLNKRKHKYTADKHYYIITFSNRRNNFGKKAYSITLQRFLYAWFNGEVPEGQVVDHNKNDPYNNDLDNLQIMSIEENLRKRFTDNPDGWVNQYGKRKTPIEEKE